MGVTNTLAYYGAESTAAVKRYLIQAPGVNALKNVMPIASPWLGKVDRIPIKVLCMCVWSSTGYPTMLPHKLSYTEG